MFSQVSAAKRVMGTVPVRQEKWSSPLFIPPPPGRLSSSQRRSKGRYSSPHAMVLAAEIAPIFLSQAVAIVVAAAVIAYLSYRVGLVPIVGFLLAGLVIGPHALGLVGDPAVVDAVAEIGVILLLFTIGLEFSLGKLASLSGLIFGGGGLQVVLASGGVLAVLVLAGVDWRSGLFSGFLVSLSSTAIVLKLLADRGETATTRGQVMLGLLIFQDLAVIVMVLVVPILGATGGSADRHRLGAREGARAHRDGARRRATPDAAASRACRIDVLAGALPSRGDRNLLRNCVADALGRSQSVAGRFPRGSCHQREPFQPSGVRGDHAAADPLQRHVLRLDRDAPRPAVPRAPPAARGRCLRARPCRQDRDDRRQHHGPEVRRRRGRGLRTHARPGRRVLVRAGSRGPGRGAVPRRSRRDGLADADSLDGAADGRDAAAGRARLAARGPHRTPAHQGGHRGGGTIGLRSGLVRSSRASRDRRRLRRQRAAAGAGTARAPASRSSSRH